MPVVVDETLRQWGENIRVRRIALGLTQYDLADKIGVRQPTVWRWEAGLMEPKRLHKGRLAEVLSTDVRLLFPMTRGAVA